jgi:hypothetical protein
VLIAACLMSAAAAEERREAFDRDPGWEGRNHRSTAFAPRRVVQQFGYSRTTHAGGTRPGEIGGHITPAAEAAYYAKRIAPKNLSDRLTASGTLLCASPRFHVLIGFFNSRTLNEWRTPNTIALRLLGRGDRFFAFVEYATSRWRAGGDSPGGFAVVPDPETGRSQLRGFATGRPHTWSLTYDPAGNGGSGAVTVTLDDETAVCHLDPGHKADGATFDRFGLLNVMKSADDGGEIWLDDVTILGERHPFDRDPRWEGVRNRRTYLSANVRPRFDFGYSPTRHAGGKAAGELGGLIFRGDCREAARMASYGDRLEPLDLSKPLRASGRVVLRRGVSDSTTLLGFYHSVDSTAVTPSQASGWPKNFLGVAIEGPSREGFFFYPACRFGEDTPRGKPGTRPPYIYPDGKPHDWTLEYLPDGANGRGRITVTLDGRHVTLDLEPGETVAPARFDRFGIITTWIDGNGQEVYFDDLAYTCRQ